MIFRLKYFRWNRFASKSVSKHLLFLIFFLFDHIFHFSFPYCLWSDLVSNIKTERLWHSNAISTFFTITTRPNIVIISQSWFPQILVNRSWATCMQKTAAHFSVISIKLIRLVICVRPRLTKCVFSCWAFVGWSTGILASHSLLVSFKIFLFF